MKSETKPSKPAIPKGMTKLFNPEAPPPVIPDLSGKLRLIQAAEIEFSQKGFEGASVLSIAQRAGVKQPLLNYHFGGKEGLWRAVVASAYAEAEEFSRAVDQTLESADPLTHLKAQLKTFTVINVLHPSAHTLVFKEVAQGGPRLDWIIENYMKPFHARLDTLIRECQDQGLIKPYPIEYGSIMMTGMLTSVQSSLNMLKGIYGVDSMTPKQAELHADQLIDALFEGITIRTQKKVAQKPDSSVKSVKTATKRTKASSDQRNG
ncbi:TetR/AcrR family transcriptional regulator [Undibacterium sp.]|jgi:AcrR family transcriptional regulator|uniref:TetR/AcrR family transcriptional regulator n=1 Tax=Undibacterium sp. TaxID=1914977 RepID=UPI002CB5CEE0|nr:TetR/AcrR family transcriptional regulator [Undibacterium sp.]HTD05112.1 TetR/AcrR family transcriptional regulator [Undibacterium sp.]